MLAGHQPIHEHRTTGVSAVLARTEPRALVWPALVFAGVLIWHLGGLVSQTPFAWWS
jgi:hypothetical protein